MNNFIYRGHLIQKRYGQNFLIDQFVINCIISIINPMKEQAMVEIGPGLSALTKPICNLLDHLIVIEIDQNLAERLQAHPFLNSKLTVYRQNAITVDFKKLSKNIGKPLRIFGNLPYNISTKLIFHLLNHISNITDMHFMLQKEVADRLVARQNSKMYGRLSVMVQYYCEVKIMMEVLPSAFIPSPKVRSSIVRIVPRFPCSHPVKNIQMLRYVVTRAFNQRRKTIRNSLYDLFSIRTLTKLNIDPKMRAENISITQFCKMANYMTDSIKNDSFKKKTLC